MITGFSYDTRSGEWQADWQTSKSWTFRSIYKNSLGYFIKFGKKVQYLTDKETEKFNKERKELKKQLK